MSTKAAVNLKDWYGLLAVWELREGGWKFFQMARLREAIALCRGFKRSVFPTGVDPNLLSPKSRRVQSVEEVKIPVRVLVELQTQPGQSRKRIAEKLGVDAEDLKTYLQRLIDQGKIHRRQLLSDRRIVLYYLSDVLFSANNIQDVA